MQLLTKFADMGKEDGDDDVGTKGSPDDHPKGPAKGSESEHESGKSDGSHKREAYAKRTNFVLVAKLLGDRSPPTAYVCLRFFVVLFF